MNIIKTHDEIQNNFIAKLFSLGRAHGIEAEIVRKADIFPSKRSSAYSVSERGELLRILNASKIFLGAHHFRDSDECDERDAWAEQNTVLEEAIQRLQNDRKPAEFQDTLIETEVWLSEILTRSSADKSLSVSITRLCKEIRQEVAKIFSRYN